MTQPNYPDEIILIHVTAKLCAKSVASVNETVLNPSSYDCPHRYYILAE